MKKDFHAPAHAIPALIVDEMWLDVLLLVAFGRARVINNFKGAVTVIIFPLLRSEILKNISY
jgi:hypothetical protein